MIQKLIDKIITILCESFAGTITNPAAHIKIGPISIPGQNNLPQIVLYTDKLEINQSVKDTGSSQPRPQEIREEIALNETNPSGPYSLKKTPLEKSTRCKIIYDRGKTTERQIMLLENKDFTINYQNASLIFNYDISGASMILLTYTFVGTFTISEFRQNFLVDIYDKDMNTVEKWSSLVSGIILTNHDELVEHFNFIDKTEFTVKNYQTSHTIDCFQLLTGTPEQSNSIQKFQIKFIVTGQLKLTKQISEGYGLIEKIHSAGKVSSQPVDIEIGLE